MNVALSHPIRFFLNASTRVYIRALKPILKAAPNQIVLNSTAKLRNSRCTFLSPRRRNHYHEIPPNVPPDVSQSPPDVSTKNIYTWGYFIYLEPRPFRGSLVTSPDSIPSTLRRTTAHQNLICAIQTLQEYSLAIWTGRNDMLHSNTVIPTTIRESQVNSEIQALYALQSTFTARVQLYFQQPLTKLLGTSYRTRQRWLIITKLATAQQCQLTNGQTQLTSYAFSLHTDMTFARQHANTPQPPIAPPSTTIQTRLTKFFTPTIR